MKRTLKPSLATLKHRSSQLAVLLAINGAMLAGALPSRAQTVSPGERLSLNEGWRFTKDDPAGVRTV